MTSCFTTAMAPALGAPTSWTIYHGFSSMDAWIRTPSLIDYTPRSGSIADLARAIDRRWVHCVNAQTLVHGEIAAQPWPRPWIIGEMGFNGYHSSIIETELEAMSKHAMEGKGFLGSFFFQFQTAYFKWGSELNFGMFGLGPSQVGTTGELEGKRFPVHCLTSRQWAFEQPSSACKDDCNYRAKAVAKAFGGQISGSGVCLDDPPLGQKSSGAKRRRLRHNATEPNDLYA